MMVFFNFYGISIKIKIFSTFHMFIFICHTFLFFMISILYSVVWFASIKHIMFFIRIYQCLVYDNDYTDHYYFSYQCLYFRALIKNESFYLFDDLACIFKMVFLVLGLLFAFSFLCKIISIINLNLKPKLFFYLFDFITRIDIVLD